MRVPKTQLLASLAMSALLAMSIAFLATPAQATILLSNLANAVNGNYGGRPDSANPFKTGAATMSVVEVGVVWGFLYPAPAVNRVGIFTDQAGFPSTTQVGSFFTNPAPTALGLMVYTGYAILAPNTIYWMVVDISDESRVAYNNTSHAFFADPSTRGATIREHSAYGNNETASWNDDSGSLVFGLGGCASDSTTAYLLSCRFRVEIEWTDFSGVTRDAFVASAGTSDTALFYWTNPNNWEVLIKAIDACTLNDKYWIYFGAATNVGYRITVTDTVGGGAPKIYTNAVGHLAQATNDSAAFDCD